MELEVTIDTVRRIAAARAGTGNGAGRDRASLEAGLRNVTVLRSWLTAAEADLTRQLAQVVPFPEAALADTTRESAAKATRTIERSTTLDAAPALAAALDDGQVTAAHVDAVTRTASGLDAEQCRQLIDRCDTLTSVASAATVDQWAKRVRLEAKRLQSDDGMARLDRQRRATTLSTWVDDDGMWNLRGRFDPVTGVRLASRLEQAVETLFAEQTPDTSPSDPIAKQRHLRALALARLIDNGGGTAVPGRPEFVVVVDTSGDTARPASDEWNRDRNGVRADAPDAHWEVTWPIPVEIPTRILHDLVGESDAQVHAVIVRNGVVLYAPGNLDLGRSTRLANRAQRRALRGLYATCAIPGCDVGYAHCKLHHIIWWRHGGRTDLQNLLPVCTRHHTNIHHDNWNISLGANRELTVTYPDGTTMATGPPHRDAA